MRLLRRLSRQGPPAGPLALTGVIVLDEAGGAASGTVADEPGRLLPMDSSADVELGAHGVVVIRAPQAGGGPLPVPVLVPWSSIRSVSADDAFADPGGRCGQVVAVEAAGEPWADAPTTVRLVVPAAEVAPVLAASASFAATVPGAAVALPDGESVPGPVAALRAQWHRGLDRVRGSLDRRRAGPVVAGGLALALIAGSATPIFVTPASGALGSVHHRHARDVGNAAEAARHPDAHLAAATSAPAPAPPSLAGSPPLQSHEIFGYAPYWTLPQSSSFDVNDLTTLAYFSVDVNGDGTLDQSGAGWNGYQSQDLVDLVNRAHAAGDRVVLTVTCFSQSALDAITSDPNAPQRLSTALIGALQAKNLDGVNFDFEGEGSADRQGLTSLITQVSGALHATNPHWQVTMATYASAAADSAGFYDIASLAPAVDGFFVMAYDMNDRSTPSPTAPLTGGGFNDTEALQQFTAVVPPQKVILGVPYYGYDWPTTDGTNAAQSTGPESPLSVSMIDASGHPTYWDPSTQTPWTSYQVGSQWHETYFDDPTSLALKAELAAQYHIAGLGIWALGMDGNDPAMLAALLGNSPAVKDSLAGPAPGPPGTGYTTVGTFDNAQVALTPSGAPPPGGTQVLIGTLSALSTNDPALACLQTGAPLDVWSFSTMPGVDVVWASQPQDCATAIWIFATPPSATGPPSSPTTPAPTTTTTAPPSSPPTTWSTLPPTTTTVPPTTTTSTSTTTTSTTSTTTPGG